MSRNRLTRTLVTVLLLVIVIISAYLLLGINRTGDRPSVSVIVNDSNDERWTTMREGLEQAADDRDVEVNFVSTGTFGNISEEEELMEREIENGADGIIVQPVSDGESDGIYAKIASEVRLILIDSWSGSGKYTSVTPDNENIGEKLGDMIISDLGDRLSGKKIGVLTGNQKELAMQQRLEGFKKSIGSAADIAWCIYAGGDENDDTDMNADIMVALDNSETERAVDFLLQNGNGSLLYGEGCSEKTVYYLDKGIISGMVVPNEFNMGYLGVSVMADQLERKKTDRSTVISCLCITRDNLYDEANQKLLFPIVQ